ncbi:pyridoxal phosphate-dependent aminotransferase [Bacteroidales bacterium OttesenSCG-928-B11]|nr:pyridoxal phosphate-dependent aminotransferase [Bacteroidales bacterium OttesenSCG-928-E04]MDL2312069.1 pyridoxal phosphate-dependent aminotransferase [Bacteroidales bacterium OttesenSCG-928-B11]MDL2325679.1 pyridoxal phosphate-dependent aminotransferase [Bacteroidales bacterium OttesenSCG-928-A14]
MKNKPIPEEIVNRVWSESGIKSIETASIREVKKLINDIEKASGKKFVRMEMGIPGLPACQIGVDAQINALNNGVAALYPDIEGIPELKQETSKFVKNFLDLNVSPASCIPTVGSMMGGMAGFMTFVRANKERDTTLFIDPGFPVQKQQHRVLGLKYETFDVYNYRQDKLKDKLESYLSKGNIHTIMYSNPNNPSWICFTEKELQIIGEMANKYGVFVFEDLAYFGMDFRNDISQPGRPPFQPTVGKYTDNFALLISSSKAFSYAGERIGMLILSDKLFNDQYPDLVPYFNTPLLGKAIIFGAVYAISSGTSHSAQYALAAILKACNDGTYNFLDEVSIYGKKAQMMKKMFLDSGFQLVYDKDDDKDLADGFYFTISYPGLSGEELLKELLYYGISAISLTITGSEHTEGLRACVSLVPMEQLPELEERLKSFRENHKD